ncbi:MAG: hypothetical protein KDK39_16245 [Leptospiraceae bacterium]|nr:hypothetical protein [Leptospiraceae bacterium]
MSLKNEHQSINSVSQFYLPGRLFHQYYFFSIVLAAILTVTSLGQLAAQPLETPRIQGIANDGSYVGTVRPVFTAPPGVRYEAAVSHNGDEDDFESGQALYQPGDYVLTVKATRASDGRKMSITLLTQAVTHFRKGKVNIQD